VYRQITNECGRWPLIQPGCSQVGKDLESPQNCFAGRCSLYTFWLTW